MTPSAPDWQEISGLLLKLDCNRVEVRQACLEEIELIEDAIHAVNKKLDGFAFQLITHLEVDELVALIRVELINLREKAKLPWTYRASYHYGGFSDGYLAKPAGEDSQLQIVEREKLQVGMRRYPEFERIFGVMAYFNLKDTPRGAVLV